MNESELARWNCGICGKEVTAPRFDEPEFFFWQVKKIGSTRYNIEYAFCSKGHMMQYLKSKKESTMQTTAEKQQGVPATT